MQPLFKRCGAEFFGTFWLVLGGCGSAVLAAGVPQVGIGYAGVALAFGLTVLTMAYAVGHISGGHFNPAVTVGLAASGRFGWRDVPPYIVAQVVGAIVAAATLASIAQGVAGFGQRLFKLVVGAAKVASQAVEANFHFGQIGRGGQVG